MPITLPTPKKVLGRTLTAISLTCLLLLGLTALSLKTPLLNSWQAFTIQTGSMEPTIPTGALIFAKTPASPETIQINDIITFEEPGYQNKLVTHRVHAINESNNYITKGDANPQPDNWVVPFSRVKGVGHTTIPLAGQAISFIRSPLGLLLFIAIPVLLVIWQEGRNIINALVDRKLDYFFSHLHRAGYRLTPPPQKTIPKPNQHQTSQAFTNQNLIRPSAAHTITHHPTIKSKSITKKISVTAAACALCLLTTPAFAYFISNATVITNSTISTATNFPQPNPSPSTSPSPTQTPSSSPTPYPSGQVGSDCDINLQANLQNSNTGPNSTNENQIEVSSNCTHTTTNQAQVDNQVHINANTGQNTQSQNNQTGNIETGDITLDLNISTTSNQQ